MIDDIHVCMLPMSDVTFLPSKSPIQESLIDFSDSGMNKVAADIFLGERQDWREQK